MPADDRRVRLPRGALAGDPRSPITARSGRSRGRDDSTETRLRLSVHGVRFPYTFEKVHRAAPARLDPPRLRAHQPGSVPLQIPLVGASAAGAAARHAHPSAAGHAGARRLVEGRPPGRVCWPSTPGRSRMTATGNEVDLGLILRPESRSRRQALHHPPERGLVRRPRPGGRVLRGDALPASTCSRTSGLSINLGGWPVDRPAYYNLGLEPCNGYPDRLDLAVARATAPSPRPASDSSGTSICTSAVAPISRRRSPRLREGSAAA